MMSRQLLTNGSRYVAALGLVAIVASVSHAQCGGCAPPAIAPTVAYSPVAVAQPVPVSPVVYQSAVPTPRAGWYPGKYIGRLFNGIGSAFSPRPAVSAPLVAPPTFTTAAYRPTFPPSYTAGYAPTAYSVGYAPTTYAAVQQTAAYPSPAVMPSPTVTLSPVSDCCCGSSACSACSGAVTAGYSAPLAAPAGGCANCQGGGAPATYEQPAVYQQPAYPPQPAFTPQPGFQAPAGAGGYPQPTPAPALPRNDNTPEQRQSFRPEPNPLDVDKSNYDLNSNLEDTTSYFQAPELFNPRDRTTRRPSATTAPVWNAVYQQPESRQTRQTAYRTAKPVAYEQPARNKQVGASGWRSSSN